jgi:hypothetical protein
MLRELEADPDIGAPGDVACLQANIPPIKTASLRKPPYRIVRGQTGARALRRAMKPTSARPASIMA